MKVNEIFYSIQGESSHAGRPCAFIRLTACDLRCAWCDTAYAFYEGREMSVPEILAVVEEWPTRLALVTGGEPLLQNEVHALLGALLARGYEVSLETGGHVALDAVDPRVRKIMDIKCPSSGMAHHNRFANVGFLTKQDEVKFVVADREDFDWACGHVRRLELTGKVGEVLFSPVYGRLPYDRLAAWVLESGLPARMQLQLHRIIWPGKTRGV